MQYKTKTILRIAKLSYGNVALQKFRTSITSICNRMHGVSADEEGEREVKRARVV